MTLAGIGACLFACSLAMLLIMAFCMAVKGVVELFADGDWVEGMLGGLVVLLMLGFGIMALCSG